MTTRVLLGLFFYAALILCAYFLWERRWFFTPDTSRLRDLGGFVVLVTLAVLLSHLIASPDEVCIASQTIEAGQEAVQSPVVCE